MANPKQILRGLLLAVTSLAAGIPLTVAAVLALALLPLGIGFVLVPPIMLGIRELAQTQRRWAAEWCDVPIRTPYRPLPEGAGFWGRCRRLLTDPATWRDLLWVVLNMVVGFVLGVLAVGLPVYGLEGVLVAPWVGLIAHGYGWGPFWPLHDYGVLMLASVPLGVLMFGVGLVIAPRILRVQALFSAALLAPTHNAALRLRVQRLADTRSAAVDASAAELRRIERDLHDGAQARIAALGMSLGMAEDLFRTDPEAALALLAEARESSSTALNELRELVRGIHPPVLAERGLAGAVRALALGLPLRVEVDIDLPGRPAAPVESAGYFAVTEVLANVVKHSGASVARVRIRHSRGALVMVVEDDGRGGADPSRGTGLRGIESRLAPFDGTMAVISPTGGPTVITMELPCALSSPKTSPYSGTA